MAEVGDVKHNPPKPKPVNSLKQILENNVFCTVCLDTNEDLLHFLDDSILREDWEGALPIRDIFEAIFGDVNEILLSNYICEPCKSSAASSYSFITKTRRTAKIYTEYFKQLDKQTTDLATCIIDNKRKTAMIILEDIKCPPKKTEETRPKKRDTKQCPHCISRPCVHEWYLQVFHKQKMQRLKKMTCAECHQEIGRTSLQLIAHVNKEHLDIQTNVCEECGKCFHLEYFYKKHFKYHHNNKHVCTSCSRKFRSEKHLSNHMETCKKSVKSFKCSKCPVLSETKLRNQIHMATHAPGYSERRLKRLKRNTEPKQMLNRRGNIYKCLTCEKLCNTKLELRLHMRKHKKKPNLCLYCNKQFECREDYLSHVQTDEHRKNMPQNIFRHHCEHCDYAARTPIMLNAHVNRVHLNVRPFQCEHCENCYFDNRQLKEHMKIHTGQIKPKVCDICGINLSCATALKKHRRLHTGDKPYSCPHCDVQENCASAIKNHIMRKHMEATVSCPLCDMKFHTLGDARGHVRKAHWKSKEKFDYTKLKGLSPKDYDFFRDRRKASV